MGVRTGGDVADLLECLIQIKGLADTPRRLALRTAKAAASSASTESAARQARDVARCLLSAEARFRLALSLMLSRDRPALPRLPPVEVTDSPAPAVGECERAFATERAETVRVLEACSAGQLNRTGVEPARGPMTVADLVAVMLAHDTDRLGELVTR
jgi:hypothetical protein